MIIILASVDHLPVHRGNNEVDIELSVNQFAAYEVCHQILTNGGVEILGMLQSAILYIRRQSTVTKSPRFVDAIHIL